MKAIAVLVVVAAACEPSPSQPPPTAGSTTGVAPRATSGSAFDDVRDVGTHVFAVGRPAFRIGDESQPGLAVGSAFVIGANGDALSVWDAATGQLVSSLDSDATFAVSSDGTTLAASAGVVVHVYRAPFGHGTALPAECNYVLALSRDGQLLACGSTSPLIWDVTAGKKLAELHLSTDPGVPRGAKLSAETHTLWWATEQGIWRWDYAAALAPALVYRAPSRVLNSSFASAAPVASLGMESGKIAVVDLGAGSAAQLSAVGGNAVSPSGNWLATFDEHSVHVRDVATGSDVWSASVADHGVGSVAFGPDDHVLAYTDSNQVHVVDVLRGARTYPAPARFAGWLGEGIAAIDHGGRLSSLTLPGGATGVASRASIVASTTPAIELSAKTLKVAGKTMEVGRRGHGLDNAEWQPEFWRAALTVDAQTAAVVIRRADLGPADSYVADPRDDVRHNNELASKTECTRDAATKCVDEYLAQLWSVGGQPRKLWEHRLARNHGIAPASEPAAVTGQIAIDRAGRRILIGTATGDIQVVSGADASQLITLHHSAITRIELSPGGGWVLSEDAAGEQRLWQLP